MSGRENFHDMRAADFAREQYERADKEDAAKEPTCAACQGDPEALDLHVCGKEPFS